MDIDELVRRARPHASPDWSTGPQAQQVLGEVLSQPADSTSRSTSHTGVRRSAVRWSFLGTGLVGAAAAAALVVPAALTTPEPGGRPAPPVAADPGGPVITDVPAARDILLAAATRAEGEPVRTGRYWHVRKELVSGPIRVGTKPDTYYVMQREVDESWQARNAADDSWYGRRHLGVRPRTAADEKAWRAAGSPTTWNQGPSDTADKRDLILSTRPGKGQLVKAGPDDPRGEGGPLDHRWDAVRRLPTDDDALRDHILRGIRLDADFPAGSESENIRLFGELTGLLLDAPAPPKVRAAALRVLAGIPGVRSLGEVRDAAGRPGLGVEMSMQSKDISWTYQIIVDAGTHVVLAEKGSSRQAGRSVPIKEQSTLVFAAEWSDAKPRIPAVSGE